MVEKISGAVFIKDNNSGYCLWESISMLLPVLDELVVLDLGSTDGTLELLQEIEDANSKVRLIYGEFPENKNSSNFATLANQVIQSCTYDNVIYWQADEIWHPILIQLMRKKFEEGNFDLSFWRIQFKENWQVIKWYPHIVHRVGKKNNFHFADEPVEGKYVNTDGMNSDRYMDATLCSTYGAEYFPKWGKMTPDEIKPYIGEMITDVSNIGGFINNIIDKRKMHGPFWNEGCVVDGEPCEQWYRREINNPNWTKLDSPFNIPPVLRYHVGKTKYTVRPELIEQLKGM